MAEANPSTSESSEIYNLEDFRCPVCQNIFQTPVRTNSCHHVFCRKCLLMAITARGAHCPLCRGPLDRWETSRPTRASDIETKMKLLLEICMCCGKRLKLYNMRLHYKSCRGNTAKFGTAATGSQLQSNPIATNRLDALYKCPLCHEGNLNRNTLLDHCNLMHHVEVAEAVCPICSVLPGGDANFASKNIVGHLNARHKFNYEEFMPFPQVPENVRLLSSYKDIPTINLASGLNLFEGDIKRDSIARNAIIGSQYRWPLTVPYYLEDSLEINAKGVILKAFERFRLKTCLDFKPWNGESNYVSVFSDNGCYSYIGRRNGKQQLSIGVGCDTIEIVQHEFLHALGFYHEQSRSDRDDYVTIFWANIQSGHSHNFLSYSDTKTSFLGVPYDYTSVMHYSSNAFSTGNPTIQTKNAVFNNLIGKQMDLSANDVLKLNRLYNCSSSLTFLDSCSFESDDICAMLQSSNDSSDWQYVTSIPEGPEMDHTYMGKSQGSFMHFDTSTGTTGDEAILESRLFYPARGFQCLEFFYYHSGNESDRLNIWIKEYTNDTQNGILTFVNSVNGPPADYWQIHHSKLGAKNKFRFVFQGIKGDGNSTGGFSIDDINLSETECPDNIWHIRNFTRDLNTKWVLSPPYYSKDGYAYQIGLGEYPWSGLPFNIVIYLYLVSGANDATLQWPCPWRQVTVEFMDQNPNAQQRTSNMKSITTDPSEVFNGHFMWDNPAVSGMPAKYPNKTSYNITFGLGSYVFTSEEWLYRRDFLKGGDAFISISMEDISHLKFTQPMPVTSSSSTLSTVSKGPVLCVQNICVNGGTCIIENSTETCRCPVYEHLWFIGERCEIFNKGNVCVLPSFITLLVVILVNVSIHL